MFGHEDGRVRQFDPLDGFAIASRLETEPLDFAIIDFAINVFVNTLWRERFEKAAKNFAGMIRMAFIQRLLPTKLMNHCNFQVVSRDW